jgi:hypothetical protein
MRLSAETVSLWTTWHIQVALAVHGPSTPVKAISMLRLILIIVRGHGYLHLADSFSNTGFWNIDDFAGILAKNLARNSRLPRIFFFGVDPPRDVPEPLSLALLGGGLLALVMLGRRRRTAL